jgi:nucleotide-binding universal stress UspA family protein
MERIRLIVVGTDFSDGASRAFEQAVDVARALGASIACVHAYEDPPGTALSDDRSSVVQTQLEELVAESNARSRGVRVEVLVRRGAPWEKLLNVASDLDAGLIVVGSSGQRDAAPQFVLGTVTARLIARSTRLVLVVPTTLEAPFIGDVVP